MKTLIWAAHIDVGLTFQTSYQHYTDLFLVVVAVVWLRGTETEMSAALWVLVAREGIYLFGFLVADVTVYLHIELNSCDFGAL